MFFRKLKQFLAQLFGVSSKGATMANAKKPKFDDVDVRVTKLTTPDPDWPAGYKFELEKGGSKMGKKLEFNNNNHPGFIVVFNIVDPGGTGCQFLPDPDDAMWVQPSGLPDPPCPSNPAYWSQFRAIDVVGNDQDEPYRALVVSNKNDYKQMFSFTLRFEIPGCPAVAEFDPIGSNQNGRE